MFRTHLVAGRGTGLAVAVMLAAATLAPVQAAESPLKVNGFGTLGAVYSDEDRADFVSSLLVPEGAGYSNSWSAKVDTKLGIQMSVDLAPRTSAVAQFVFEQQHDGTYSPAVEWLNLSFDLTQDLELRLGRMVLPLFMTSEYRKVGYASTSSRPPSEVYHLAPVTNTDGINLTYRARFHEVTNTLQVLYGSKDVTLPNEGGEVDVENGLTLANTLEWGATTVFVSYTNIRLTLDSLDPLFDGFRQFGPPGEAIADQYQFDSERFEFFSIGTRYDPGDWFVAAEWARNRNRTVVGDNRGWYITGGYRFGAITPYMTVAEIKAHDASFHLGLDIPQAQPLNAMLNEILDDAPSQSRLAAGVRWDFARSLALKVQVDHIDLHSGSGGVLTNTQPEFERGGNVALFSTTLDFVF